MIPVHEPDLGPTEAASLRRCVEAGFVSGFSPPVQEFERAFAGQVRAAHALATSSGTTALHLAFAAIGIGAGDEVVVPSFTFAPCADMVTLTGARPVLVDADPTTFNITPSAVLAGLSPVTRAVLAVHMFGHPCDVTGLRALCDERGLTLIEDCAQALGALHRGRPVGSDGTIACYSFYANKVITTGEGGMVTTNDSDLGDRLDWLRSHASVADPNRAYLHTAVGFNYRMPAFSAAVGSAQLTRLDAFLTIKADNARRYTNALRDFPGVTCPADAPPGDQHANWAYGILIDDHAITGGVRGMADHLRARHIQTRRFYHPLHLHPGAPDRSITRSDLSTCEDFAPRGLILPSGNTLRATDVDEVVAAIADYTHR